MERASVHFRRMPIRRFCVRLLAATVLVCLPSVSEDAGHTTGDYETPGPVSAKDFLPKSAFAGKKLFVEKIAENNGLQNTYRIRVGAPCRWFPPSFVLLSALVPKVFQMRSPIRLSSLHQPSDSSIPSLRVNCSPRTKSSTVTSIRSGNIGFANRSQTTLWRRNGPLGGPAASCPAIGIHVEGMLREAGMFGA